MSTSRIRVVRAEDAARYAATDLLVWSLEVPSGPVERLLVGIPEDQRFAAEVEGADPGTHPGVYGVFPMSLALPAGGDAARLVPCAGLSWVGVHPDHRRRGVLTAMMGHHLEQVHATDGVHLSVLHASEIAIYGRYGYGTASLELALTLSRGTTLTAPHLEAAAGGTTTELRTVTDAGVPERMHACHRAVAAPGGVVGAVGYYERLCTLLPEELRDKEPWRVLFARRDGRDVGFALFRRTPKWERARPVGELAARFVIGDPAGQLALLRRLLDSDLVSTIKVDTVGVEDPLLSWLGGPRGATAVEVYDSLWVRLVDLPEALQARRWSAACDVVVAVSDTAAPWNDGSWRIVVDPSGRAEVTPTRSEPDVSLPVEALGAAYLGGSGLLARLRAGLVQEHRSGAVTELSRALRTDVAPTASVMF